MGRKYNWKMDIIKDKYVREPSDISGKTRNVWAENTIGKWI
jgi:hypothetical protein